MKIASVLLSLSLNKITTGKGVQRREDIDTPEEAVQTKTDDNYDTEYDVTDYDEEAAYDEYESSGEDGWNIFGNVGQTWEQAKNWFNHGRHEDTDYYEGSSQVNDWWDNWQENEYMDEDYEGQELVTRYPIPELNEHGHVDMADLAFRDTLDEYFDIFVIILSGSILALLACAAYGRVRNIRYMKKAYGNLDDDKKEENERLL